MATNPRQAATRAAANSTREEVKRSLILQGAARLFGSRPFDEVRLDDLAQLLRIGKGTIYIYFKSKEELYGALLMEGIEDLLERMQTASADQSTSAWGTLEAIVREMVAWAHENPHFFHLMPAAEQRAQVVGIWEKRRELSKVLERVIRRGIRAGEFEDAHPELTAHFIPGCLRSVMRHGPQGVGREALARHILRVVGQGILNTNGPK